VTALDQSQASDIEPAFYTTGVRTERGAKVWDELVLAESQDEA